MDERTFETILAKYPELIEDGLEMKGRQVIMYGRRMDLLFDDAFQRKLIVELKAGPIKDQHIGQVLAYEGMLLSADDPNIRVMLIGNRVPPNIRRALDHHGIAWKELTVSSVIAHLNEKSDSSMLDLFTPEELEFPSQPEKVQKTPIIRSTEKDTILLVALPSRRFGKGDRQIIWECVEKRLENRLDSTITSIADDLKKVDLKFTVPFVRKRVVNMVADLILAPATFDYKHFPKKTTIDAVNKQLHGKTYEKVAQDLYMEKCKKSPTKPYR